jgi:hypothetical protein
MITATEIATDLWQAQTRDTTPGNHQTPRQIDIARMPATANGRLADLGQLSNSRNSRTNLSVGQPACPCPNQSCPLDQCGGPIRQLLRHFGNFLRLSQH